MGAENVLTIKAPGQRETRDANCELEMMREMEMLARQIADGHISLQELRLFRTGEGSSSLRRIFHDKGPKYIRPSEWLNWYQYLYRHLYRLDDVNLADVKIPEQVSSYDFVIVVAKGMNMEIWLEAHTRVFGPVDIERVDRDLDRFFSISDRKSDSNYAVRTQSAQEVDTKVLNVSAEACRKNASMTCMSMLERAIFEHAFTLLTFSHPDQEHYTITPGTLSEHDEVPVWHWSNTRGVHQLVIDRILSPIKSEFNGPREVLVID